MINCYLNNYDVIKILKSGKNTISEVTEIMNRTTHKFYALKVIKGINTPLYNVIFQREVGALTKLRTCDNIVKLLYYDTCNDKEYGKCGRVFMEYIDGQTLEQIKVFDLSNQEKFNIIKQLIDAIQSAHENSIIHRDIDPKNIMINQDNKVKLIDFGMSKIKDMVNSDTTYQFATNRYAAPEVHEHSENATEKSDIYSLGAVFYYIFTGEQPPISNEFNNVIQNTNGIDIDLKEVIRKMVSISPNDRYNDIFDVKKSLLKLLARFNKSDKTYVFIIPTKNIDYMKNVSLVSANSGYLEIVNNIIYEDFLESFIYVEDEDTVKEKYIIYGLHYAFECYYNVERQEFWVNRVLKLQPFIREDIKKKALILDGEVKFILSGNSIYSNNNYELTIAAKDSKKNYLSSANVNSEYIRNFYAWNKLLEIMEDEYKNKIIKVKYNKFIKENEHLIFYIDEQSYYLLEENKNEDLSFIYEKETNRRNKNDNIGNFEGIYLEDDKFILKVTVCNKNLNIKLPPKGIICEDYKRNLVLINREKKALNEFNNEDYESSSNLKSIFSCIDSPSFFETPKQTKFFNKDLDLSQKSAVIKAINSQDISLIQGPPGTGKTNVIIEIIRQILKVNKQGDVFKQKILLVSQEHAAVDKMLEDLDNFIDDSIKVIRIGRDENLTEMVKQKYSEEHAQVRWVNKIIDNSNRYADTLLLSLKINIDEFDNYYKSKLEINKSKENIDPSNYQKSANYIKYFEDKYKEHIEKEEFKYLMIQRDWVNRIIGRSDIQQHFIKNAVIISGTCTGVVSNYVIKDMRFDYVIIDEAAKATFPELLISIIRGKKVIMVGDQNQLPPVLDDELINRNKKKFIESDLDYKTLYNSIFMRLFNYLPNENKQILNTQYRMHPTIGTMISQVFYNNDINNGVSLEDRKHTIEPYKNNAIVWIDTSECKGRYQERVSTTYRNLLESNIVKEQLRIINENSRECNYDVGIITPYSGQKNLIRNEIQPIDCSNIKGKVIVNSVDAFQGGEKDIIIYSTVRSYTNNSIGFLKSSKRLNVAFSRAKRLLIIVGDAKFLCNPSIENNMFPKILKYIRNNPEHCQLINYAKISNAHTMGV